MSHNVLSKMNFGQLLFGVYNLTISPVFCEPKSAGALTTKAAEAVPTPAVPTEVVVDPTLIDILALHPRSALEAGLALAVESPVLVDAGPVPAHAGVSPALVNVHARVLGGRQREALGAQALETAGTVTAPAVLAYARHLQAFVDVTAISPCNIVGEN